MARAAIVFAICAALAAIATAQTTAPGVACFYAVSKYRYCAPVMASSPTAKTDCATKGPDGKPDTFATQTECCKTKFGTCGYSGGPSGGPAGATCWMPVTGTKTCKKLTAAEATAGGCGGLMPAFKGLVGGFQSEAVCLAESFAAAPAGGATTPPAAGGATTLPAAGGAKPATTPTGPKTAPGVACFYAVSKYRYCAPVMASSPTAKTDCATKGPDGKPDTFATQTECCKTKFVTCGYSGGPSGGPAGATCWMPVTGTKTCKKLTAAEATEGGCGGMLPAFKGLVGGFQSEAVCLAESF